MAFLDSTVKYRDLGGTSTVKFGTAVYRGYDDEIAYFTVRWKTS